MFEKLFGAIKRLVSGDPPLRTRTAVNPFSNVTTTQTPISGGGLSSPVIAVDNTTPALQRPTPPERSPAQRPPPEPVRLTGLDGNPFAPMSDAEVKNKARGLGSLWGNPWFGRRDRIPSASDERTLLIDRAMVAHGLLTPEELQEIHAVGLQMDEIRPDVAQAQQIAAASVTRSKEEHEALKQRKKAEAAERRRLHIESVAKRKATDIIFLGRGVSRGLADRSAHVERLEKLGLPLLAEPADVAAALGLSISRLRWLAFHSEAATRVHYVRFTVPKSGGVRELSAPHRSLAAAQRWILDNILAKVAVHSCAHGFVAGRSTVTNATPHAGQAVVVNSDLKDFFPTITFARVKGVFQSLGYSPAAATVLALLCTESPRRPMVYAGQSYEVASGPRVLPQGACTSPALSNLVARRMDARFAGIATRLNWVYTRYADDLTFSASGEAATKIGYVLARIRHIAEDEGFIVNEAKTRVQRPNTAQTVTGLVVNQRAAVPRDVVRRVRAILHRARFEGLAAQNRDGRPHFDSWLRGMIAYIAMVQPEQGRRLRLAYDALQHL